MKQTTCWHCFSKFSFDGFLSCVSINIFPDLPYSTSIPTVHQGVPQLVCHRVDPVQGVGGVVVVAVPAAADLAVVVGKSVISQGLLKNLMLTWTTIMQVRHRCRPNLVSSECWYFNIKFEGGCCFVPAFCASMFERQQNLLLVRLCTWIVWVSCVYIEL
jgi:hypothetical protein